MVGCWLPGSRTTLLVAPETWAGRAGLSCAWAGCWMGKACFIATKPVPSSARLLACLTCLRLASGPAQPATRYPASGPSVYEPIQRPAQAQLSPARPAEVPGATNSVVRLQPSKKCMSWQAASHVKWRCPNTQSWSWLFSDTNYCSPLYGGQAPLKMLIPRKRSLFFQGH